MTISSLERLQVTPSWEDMVNQTNSTTDLAHPSRSQLYENERSLIVTHDALQKAARSALTQASREVIQAEEDIDATQSLLFYVKKSLSTLINQREEIKNQVKGMKDVIGARRRIPSELWLQIFAERVNEDEISYLISQREEVPPFTVLQLNWVCRKWRKLIKSQPALWHHIAIPHQKIVSPERRDRILHYIEHLGLHPPIVYMGHWNSSIKHGNSDLADVLKRITSFDRLELFISSTNNHSEGLLARVQPNVELLVLFGNVLDELGVTCELESIGIRKVQNISCLNVVPHIRGDAHPLHVNSFHLTESHFADEELMTFLKATSVSAVKLEMNFPFEISGSPSDTPLILTNLTTLTTNLAVLTTLFNDWVFLPNLRDLTVIQQSSMSIEAMQANWTSFINTHQRKDTITTLGLSSPHHLDILQLLPVYQSFIN